MRTINDFIKDFEARKALAYSKVQWVSLRRPRQPRWSDKMATHVGIAEFPKGSKRTVYLMQDGTVFACLDELRLSIAAEERGGLVELSVR